MKKFILLIIVAVVLVIAVPVGAYYMNYVNEYEVDVSFDISSSELGSVDVTNMEYTSDSMGWFTWFDTLKGHSTYDRSDYYLVFVTVTQDASGYSVTETEYLEVPVGESKELTISVFEARPGDSTIRIYVESKLTLGIVFDQSYDVTIG